MSYLARRRRRGAVYRDSTDDKIIEHLKVDSRTSLGEIGRSIGLSESAVRRRVKRMVDGGIIKRFTLEMGHEETTSAIVLVSVESATDTSKVSMNLAGLEGVRTVYEITGQYDIATIISSSSIAGINATIDALRKINGVMDTNTVIILRKIA